MFCTQCGKPIPVVAKFCASCGNQIPPDGTPQLAEANQTQQSPIKELELPSQPPPLPPSAKVVSQEKTFIPIASTSNVLKSNFKVIAIIVAGIAGSLYLVSAVEESNQKREAAVQLEKQNQLENEQRQKEAEQKEREEQEEHAKWIQPSAEFPGVPSELDQRSLISALDYCENTTTLAYNTYAIDSEAFAHTQERSVQRRMDLRMMISDMDSKFGKKLTDALAAKHGFEKVINNYRR